MLIAQMLRRRSSTRHAASRLRFAIAAMPRHSREAMLRGIEDNDIIAGAYVDHGTGGICPMLAAHRNGGRTSLASFARCWDRYTGARRPRLATEREVRVLRTYLEMSLVSDHTGTEPLSVAAERIRYERAESARRSVRAEEPTRRGAGDRDRGRELRRKPFWSWILPARRYDVYRERIAAASEQLAEQRAAELLDAPDQVANADGSPGRVNTISGIRQ